MGLMPLLAHAEWRYGLTLGGEFADARIRHSQSIGIKNGSGFRGGIIFEYQFTKFGLAFDGSLEYVRYNARWQNNTDGIRRSIGRNFIDIPLNVKYKFWIPATKNLFAPMVTTGPDFQINVGKSRTFPAPVDGGTYQTVGTERFQPGWNVGIGFDAINFIELSAGYRFALTDCARGADPLQLRTNSWWLRATILFDF